MWDITPLQFDLHFSNDIHCVPFHVPVGLLYVFFEKKMSIHVLCPFFNQIVCRFAFAIEMYEFFKYFEC